jgi:multisubunit Na+/H+ antiporter MnhC subunit
MRAVGVAVAETLEEVVPTALLVTAAVVELAYTGALVGALYSC